MASINSIQVKEFLQALTDENKLRVEKIGSGNWYWSFRSDEKVERQRQLNRVQSEVEKTRKSYTECKAALAAESTRHEQGEAAMIAIKNDLSNGAAGPTTALRTPAELEVLRQKLMKTRADLQSEVHRLRLAGTGMGDSVHQKSVPQLRRELAGFRQQAMQWTDNLYVLEQHLRELAGGDREIVAAVLSECYGDEYVDGGLRELD